MSSNEMTVGVDRSEAFAMTEKFLAYNEYTAEQRIKDVKIFAKGPKDLSAGAIGAIVVLTIILLFIFFPIAILLIIILIAVYAASKNNTFFVEFSPVTSDGNYIINATCNGEKAEKTMLEYMNKVRQMEEKKKRAGEPNSEGMDGAKADPDDSSGNSTV